MKPNLVIALLVTAVTAPLALGAEDPSRALQLAQEKGCLECHAIGWTVVGPAFTDIAARYRHDPDARATLVDSIRSGGKRHWGERFNMWPQTSLSEAETSVLVDWILSQH